jgi:hypothetical protein
VLVSNLALCPSATEQGVSFVQAKKVHCKNKSLDINLDKGSRQRTKVRSASNDESVLASRTCVLVMKVFHPHF